MSIFTEYTAGIDVLRFIMAGNRMFETGQDGVAAFDPVVHRKHHNKIVAADMADMTDFTRNMTSQDFGNRFYDIIAGIVAVNIVIRFEVVQVEIANAEGLFSARRRLIRSLVGTLPGNRVNGFACLALWIC